MSAVPGDPPPLVAPGGPAQRLNPVGKLAAALALLVGLLLTVDVVTPALVLLAELGALAAARVRWGALLRRLWLLLVAAAGLALTTLLFTDIDSGRLLVDAGPLQLRSGALLAAAGVALRLVAIALPGVVVFATTDPTDFADSLVQQLRASPRFTFGALAAFRLLPLLTDEWRLLLLARRARGLDAGWSPVRRARLFASAVFALLVAAIRRGVRLATAMESRGFDRQGPRTVARPQRFGRADWALVTGSVLVVGAASAASVALGSWRFLFW